MVRKIEFLSHSFPSGCWNDLCSFHDYASAYDDELFLRAMYCVKCFAYIISS